jgi:hypothetical protein
MLRCIIVMHGMRILRVVFAEFGAIIPLQIRAELTRSSAHSAVFLARFSWKDEPMTKTHVLTRVLVTGSFALVSLLAAMANAGL